MSAPPPPPPHGEAPKSSGLPPGKYDIFVIPEHSAGSGFLYLPSLQPNVNSFAAGFASALILVALFQSMAPAFRAWWESFHGLGNMGITMLIFGVGFGAWALGRTQKDAPPPRYGPGPSSGGGGQGEGFGGASASSGPPPNASGPQPPPHSSAPPPQPPPPTPGGAPPPPPQQEKPKSSWQRSPPQPGASRAETPKGAWEKAREETRKKEEERKAKEAEQKRREEVAKRLAELRAKEAKERLQREKDAKEKDVKEQKERDLAEKRKKDAAEKLEREKREREAKEREAKEREAKASEEQKKKDTQTNRAGSSYAYSSVGEKTSMWPNGRPAAAAPSSEHGSAPKNPGSPDKRPPPPTARTCVTDEDAHSFRPYDKPRKARRQPSVTSIGESESSWAQSHTTARTSPPPSVRGPYSTKDPDKIVIEAVYLFMNQFAKTPASQLISGVGSVTDGLILRITTEGLFIDDDVRGVPQREWDVKAWTLKLVEVWCPPHCLNSAAAASASNPAAGAKSPPSLFYKMATARRNADRDGTKALTGDDADVYLTDMMRACKDCCRLGLCDRTFKNTNIQSPSGQTGEWKAKGLHVLRATVRDQDGKRYIFVLDETESWKVAVGLQRLRRGTQVRQLGVSGMTPSDARGTLEMLGWSG